MMAARRQSRPQSRHANGGLGAWRRWLAVAVAAGCAACAGVSAPRDGGAAATAAPSPANATIAADPLPSWRDGAAKQAILRFVRDTTTEGGPDFVAPADRIALFDNDGTLWREDPRAELLFVAHLARARTEADPTLGAQSPYREFLADPRGYLQRGDTAALQLLHAVYGNTAVESFQDEARRFLAVARHPRSRAPLRDGIYQPMLELLGYLRANGYQTWLCAGSTADFMRAFAADYYGIAPQQVIGSRLALRFRETAQGNGVWREPRVDSFNDKENKPANIALQIGKRPVFAAGNVGGGGDIAMLAYSQGRRGPSFQLLIDHDDAQRESAYTEPDGASLKAAAAHRWTVVSMRRDWERVFVAPSVRSPTRSLAGEPMARPATP
ncbi:haloacid dehalogenase-like hydrolase [Cupriavidus gilardii]|uniref:HAD family hydrolase n=1 Tax=Cupriavidus gilardii TaxID=82541 RepID=UPI001ABDCB61|nr:HAD family hydrolase [Cupriavidus gilardii]MBO4121613.1 haloacid dehalogenase-like hydrolase [Cupriavidus gilardii]